MCLRDWSRSGGSYGNNTRVICCPAPGRPESAARGTSPPDNKSRGCCCRNSLPTVINPDYNMTKQRYITRIHDKIHSKSPPNRVTLPTCLHCDVTHLSLTTGVVALHILPSGTTTTVSRQKFTQSCYNNTLRPRQNGQHFSDDIFKCIFLFENVWIRIKISLKFVPKFPINNIPALVQTMAWRRIDDKPLS